MTQQHSNETSTATTPNVKTAKSDGVPEWVVVVGVLAFIFFVLPALTPILFKIFLLTH